MFLLCLGLLIIIVASKLYACFFTLSTDDISSQRKVEEQSLQVLLLRFMKSNGLLVYMYLLYILVNVCARILSLLYIIGVVYTCT